MRKAVVLSCGAYAPERVIPNSYFDELLQTDVDTWLRENVQIFERRWCKPNESTADLCERAALIALERANVAAQDIDLIVLATDTPEFISPSTASVVQDRIGANRAGTFDINTACAGFVTALDIGSKYIQADDQYEHVLVIGGYAMSKYLNLEDKKTVTLFADGAGAVVLGAKNHGNEGVLASRLLTEGQYNEWMGIYGGGTKFPISKEVVEEHKHQLQFVQKFPKELNPQIWSKLAIELSEKTGRSLEEVDQFFITQININSIWETMDLLELPRDKAHTVMHHYGYTGSACIPMALNDAWEKGKFKKGDLAFFIGSGGGLAFAAAAVQF